MNTAPFEAITMKVVERKLTAVSLFSGYPAPVPLDRPNPPKIASRGSTGAA